MGMTLVILYYKMHLPHVSGVPDLHTRSRFIILQMRNAADELARVLNV